MFLGLSGPSSFLSAGLVGDLKGSGALFFISTFFLQSGAGMDFSRIGEKVLSSVRSARSLGFLPAPPSDRPEVPARAAAAAVVARALAGIPPHQRINLPSSSEELISIYGSWPHDQNSTIDDLEETFYKEDFDPVKDVLDNIPLEGNDLTYFEEKATLRLTQLDRIGERLSRHVMEHHEEMVKGMQLVTELEQDLNIANVICMNGRRHLASSKHEVSHDLVVNTYAKKKQALLDMLPILIELRRALDMQMDLEILVEGGNYVKAFQVLSEYLQVVESLPDLAVIHEMSSGIEAWLAKTLRKLDALLLGVCQSFNHDNYLTAVDAYAIVGDIIGLAEKIQSFFMQEVLSGTHLALRDIVLEDMGDNIQRNRFTYSDLCANIPESKFRQCLLTTLDVLFKLMCSYYAIMSFDPDNNNAGCQSLDIKMTQKGMSEEKSRLISSCPLQTHSSHATDGSSTTSSGFYRNSEDEVLSTSRTGRSDHNVSNDVCSSHHSPFYQLRKDAIVYVSRALDRGRKNLWHFTTSRLSALLSCSSVCSTSTHQFLRNYEDLNVFILAGEAFCGIEALEFRQRLKTVCESYMVNFHRQNLLALKLVMEKETWVKISSDVLHVVNLAGLIGDGAPLITNSSSNSAVSLLQSKNSNNLVEVVSQKNGFASWLEIENPFMSKLPCGSRETPYSPKNRNGPSEFVSDGNASDILNNGSIFASSSSVLEDENEELLADFIDEDSQLPSRMPKQLLARPNSAQLNDEEINAHTGSSLCLLRLMDKYARLMQKLEIVNVEFFEGFCQLFGIFFHFAFEAFGQHETSSQSYRLKLALTRASQDCDHLRKKCLSVSSATPTTPGTPFTQMDVTPTIPTSSFFGQAPNTTFGLKERCAGVETILLVARVLHRSRPHLHSMLFQSNAALVEDFFDNMVDSVPDLTEHIHRNTARLLLNINGYADRISNAKWEVKELGLEHNGYVDLLLGEYKHYKTRLAHGGISKEAQDQLLVYGVEIVAEVLLEGLSRVKRCTDEGRALMSLDLQVLINGLEHFGPTNVRLKMQAIETFIKAYYLPETEYVYWAHSHPDYSKGQIIGLVNLVAAMKNWKRKTRLEVIEKIEAGT